MSPRLGFLASTGCIAVRVADVCSGNVSKPPDSRALSQAYSDLLLSGLQNTAKAGTHVAMSGCVHCISSARYACRSQWRPPPEQAHGSAGDKMVLQWSLHELEEKR